LDNIFAASQFFLQLLFQQAGSPTEQTLCWGCKSLRVESDDIN